MACKVLGHVLSRSRAPLLASVLLFQVFTSACGSERVSIREVNARVLSENMLPEEVKSWSLGEKVIEFSILTSKNLRELGWRERFNFSVLAYFCENKKQEIAVLQMVFDEGGQLKYGAMPIEHESNVVRVYARAVAATRRDIETGKLSIPPYDLTTGPNKKICIQLHGGNMGYERFDSNVFSVTPSLN
jgi:hypothetical protein